MFDRLEFVLSEAIVSLKRNTLMSFAAIATAAIALFLLGGLGYAYYRINDFALEQASQFKMRVFLREALEPQQVVLAEEQIRSIDGVNGVRYIPKEAGLQQFILREDFDVADIEGFANFAPNEFEVYIEDLGMLDAVLAELNALDAKDPDEPVNYLGDYQDFISGSLALIRWLGGVVGGVLLLVTGFLIYNTIRLTINARRREIRIMQLVGATPTTVWSPMFIEGAIQGAIGGFIAAILLSSGNALVRTSVASNFEIFGDPGPFPVFRMMLYLVSIGAFYGLICSAIAVREPRKQ
ncbi:MAG: cell division protein FtsX [Fimbriimonadaceae bacterium]